MPAQVVLVRTATTTVVTVVGGAHAAAAAPDPAASRHVDSALVERVDRLSAPQLVAIDDPFPRHLEFAWGERAPPRAMYPPHLPIYSPHGSPPHSVRSEPCTGAGGANCTSAASGSATRPDAPR